MAKKNKYGTVKIEAKRSWEIGTGHKDFRSATCTVMGDKRTKRKRTRQGQRKEWQGE